MGYTLRAAMAAPMVVQLAINAFGVLPNATSALWLCSMLGIVQSMGTGLAMPTVRALLVVAVP